MTTYGLIGFPLVHSFSRAFFQEKFAQEKLDAQYVNFEITSISEFPEIIRKNADLRGLNVTIPYKEQVIPYLDCLSEEAREIGAVNVIRISHRDGHTLLKGFNADVIGFVSSIRPLLTTVVCKEALILGTGGASKAVDYGLRSLGFGTHFVSRNPKKGMLGYDNVTPEILQQHAVIVNCTPCGMFPHTAECPPLPYAALGRDNVLFDLIYNPEETEFLARGRAQGARVKNGLEMLHLQALASWDFWNQKE